MNDEYPCTWFEETGFLLGAALTSICFALGYFGPDLANFIFH